MILKKIKLENIRSYENAELEFPVGASILSGDIGSGKTSVLLAIEFALFGLQPGQRGSSLLRNGKNRGSVALEIEIDNNTIVLERGLEKGKTVSQSYAKIQINGVEQEISVTELKNKVLSLLNYPKEFAKKTNILYKFTVYTPQEQMKQIILEKPEARLDTLRHIFGIDKYKRVKENTDIFTVRLREQSREYEGRIKDLDDVKEKRKEKQHNLEKLEDSLVELREELKKRQKNMEMEKEKVEDIEKKIKEKEKYEREAEKTSIMLLAKKETLINLKNELSKLTRELEQARAVKFNSEEFKQKQSLLKDKEKLVEEKNGIFLELMSRIRALSSASLNSKNLQEQISRIDLCPTCLQQVNEVYKKIIVSKLEEDISKYKKETLSLEKEKAEASEEIEKIKEEISRLNKEIGELNFLRMKTEELTTKENKLEELEKQKISAERDADILERQILTLKQSASVLKKFEIVYEKEKAELERLVEEVREKELDLASREKEKELTLVMIEEISIEIKKKENIKIRLIKITELEDWFSSSFLSIISSTERTIMLKLREDFSKLFNEWFNILVPEIFTVKLDEDFTPVIEQQDYQLDYSFLSGGERTAVALAYRLALNQVINSLLSRIKTKDLVILDEPTDGFSEAQLDKIRDVLNQLKVRQLILVSHEPKLESFVENIIKFRKEGGITRIES